MTECRSTTHQGISPIMRGLRRDGARARPFHDRTIGGRTAKRWITQGAAAHAADPGLRRAAHQRDRSGRASFSGRAASPRLRCCHASACALDSRRTGDPRAQPLQRSAAAVSQRPWPAVRERGVVRENYRTPGPGVHGPTAAPTEEDHPAMIALPDNDSRPLCIARLRSVRASARRGARARGDAYARVLSPAESLAPRRVHGDSAARALPGDWPVPCPRNWLSWVHKPHTEQEVQAIRRLDPPAGSAEAINSER
jgi:hypothetical protein